MSRLLLIEDDHNLGYILKEYLEMRDFKVVWSKDGDDGLKTYKNGQFDLCILDIMMPKKDGFEVAEEIKRKDSNIPLIFLTAKAMKIDKLKGFKVGCDDYIIKPVDEEELIARIKAVLRRAGSITEQRIDEYRIGSYQFNVKKQTLSLDGNEIHLTTKESKILEMLCINYGDLVDRDEVLRSLWGENNYFNRRSMDVFISKLRKYLAADSSIKITNVHGNGYILESEK